MVPSSFNSVTEDELKKQVLMCYICQSPTPQRIPCNAGNSYIILKHSRSLECDERMLSIKEILNLIPGTKYDRSQRIFDSLKAKVLVGTVGARFIIKEYMCLYI